MNTECAPESRFRGIVSVLLLLTLVCGCKLKNLTDFYIGNAGASLPGRGLAADGTDFVWTMNAGILVDRDLAPVDRIQGEQILAEAEAKVRLRAPWLKLRFILDQPLDAEYILTTLTRDKKALQAARKPENRIIDLDPADLDHNVLIEKLDPGRIQPLIGQLRALQKQRNLAGEPLVAARPQSSLLQWRLFLRDQVRYDVILTNAVIFPDEIAASVFVLNQDGTVRAAILPASGRSALEQNALLFSLHGHSQPGAGVADALSAMLLLDGPQSHQEARRRQLGTLVRFYKEGACPERPAQVQLPEEARRAVETAYQNAELACGGGGKKD